MPNEEHCGGTHEQHVKAGQQSHKNTSGSQNTGPEHEGTRGGTHEQHVKVGQQSHKNTSGPQNAGPEDEGTRSGTHEQHVKAGHHKTARQMIDWRHFKGAPVASRR